MKSELRVFIRKPTREDCSELRSLIVRSKQFHFPWVIHTAFAARECQNYIEQCQNDNFAGLLICHLDTSRIVGVANLSQIFYKSFQNAYLSYYVDVDFAGQGLMLQGVGLAVDFAFCTLGLHRLEANIQPKNKRSINLVKRLGFIKEGFSPKYLKINREWQDHERWALIVDNWSLDKIL